MLGLYVAHAHNVAFDNFKVESLEARPQSALAAEKETPPIPDWELIKTQLAQLSPQLQDLDSRINTLQVAVGSVSKNLPEAQASVTPEDLNVISQRLDSLEQLLQAQGQGKEIESLKASLGEQIAQIKRMSDAVDRMAEEFTPLRQRVESAAAKAESVESKATLGLIVGAAGVALAVLVMLGVLR